MLSQMKHPNLVGFRAAQRLNDGHLCLALEHLDLSLYALVQERQFAIASASRYGGCISPSREERAGAVFSADEILRVGRCTSAGLAYLHNEHRLMHGDVKSANVLVSRDLRLVKVCDLGVSIALTHDLSAALQHDAQYEGTEPWRPPETLKGEGERGHMGEAEICDRTDVFAFGLVVWEMLTGDVPHASQLSAGEQVYRAALGTRPAIPPLPPSYEFATQIFQVCTQPLPCQRPSAAELLDCFTTGSVASLPVVCDEW